MTQLKGTPGGGGGGGTLNVEVIGMLVGNFLENPKKYPDFDLKLQFLGLFWEKWLPFSRNFPEDAKKYQNHNFLP